MEAATTPDTVAANFAHDWREREERELSPLAARSYPAVRRHADPRKTQ